MALQTAIWRIHAAFERESWWCWRSLFRQWFVLRLRRCCRRLCSSRGRLLRRRSLGDYLFHGSFLRSGFLPGRCRFLGGCSRLCAFGGSGLLEIRHELRLCRRREFAFRLGWLRCGGFRLFPNLGPSPLLSFLHTLSGGSGEFLALTCGNFQCGGVSSGANRQHRPEFGNLSVDLGLLRLESCYGSDDDFVREFWCGHVSLSQPFTVAHSTGQEWALPWAAACGGPGRSTVLRFHRYEYPLAGGSQMTKRTGSNSLVGIAGVHP